MFLYRISLYFLLTNLKTALGWKGRGLDTILPKKLAYFFTYLFLIACLLLYKLSFLGERVELIGPQK